MLKIAFGQNKISPSSANMLKKTNKNDTFELSASQKTDENDLLKLPEREIIDKIAVSVRNHKNCIGQGQDALVYKIEDTNYCVRVPYYEDDIKQASISYDLDEKDKINHVAAKLSNGVTIMKYIEGFTLSKRRSQEVVDKALLELPVSAFHGLFRQICHAKDNGMIFDRSSTNVILNPKDKTLRAIDFNKISPDHSEIVKPLSYMQKALTEFGSLALKKQCALKIILGALEELKPGVKPCLSIDEFNFNIFLDKVQIGNPLCDSQDWAKLKEILTDIECLKIKEMKDIDVKDILGYKINEAKSVIDVLTHQI